MSEQEHGPYDHEVLRQAADDDCTASFKAMSLNKELINAQIEGIMKNLHPKEGEDSILTSEAVEAFENSTLSRRELAYMAARFVGTNRSPIEDLLAAVSRKRQQYAIEEARTKQEVN